MIVRGSSLGISLIQLSFISVNRFILTAFGSDRPGIVYRLTKELARLGANLTDSTMTDLEGQFAIMLSFEVEGLSNSDQLNKELNENLADLGLALFVNQIEIKDWIDLKDVSRVAIRVIGGDRPGIVAGISEVLFNYKANIVELKTHSTTPFPSSNYVMIILVDLDSSVSFERIRADLIEVALRLTVHLSAELIEPDTI
ncbi:hypothetical protein AXFE_36140 [Acidithrix ferrooxidans]|uniref:ACT domain-containing protein n=1 Tax=Acidithrix ferrooxidans TaxID=1280514 RepID=A0A0D8HCC1_9ACTN|nr:hypothetical protein AXFE_36140 [Acidithrix ferrooxidans]